MSAHEEKPLKRKKKKKSVGRSKSSPGPKPLELTGGSSDEAFSDAPDPTEGSPTSDRKPKVSAHRTVSKRKPGQSTDVAAGATVDFVKAKKVKRAKEPEITSLAARSPAPTADATVAAQPPVAAAKATPAPAPAADATVAAAKAKPVKRAREAEGCTLRLDDLQPGTKVKGLRAFFAELKPLSLNIEGAGGATVRFSSAEDTERARGRWEACRAATGSAASVGGIDRPRSSREEYWDAKKKKDDTREKEQPWDSWNQSEKVPEASVLEVSDQRSRAQELTKEIAWYGKDRQLGPALASFNKFKAEGLTPTLSAYANLMNAHVNSQDVEGAEKVLATLRRAGLVANVIVYTTLLKGHSRVGDMDRASKIFDEMTSQDPPVMPDLRAVSTFMRGCGRVGRTDAALALFDKMQKEWKLVPDASTKVPVTRALCQCLRLGSAKALLNDESPSEGDRKTEVQEAAATLPEGEGKGSSLCLFWSKGKCKRGKKCFFFHDLGIAQGKARRNSVEEADASAGMASDVALAAALLGEWDDCSVAIQRARKELLAAKAAVASLGDAHQDTAAHQEASRGRVRSEVERVEAFAKKRARVDLEAQLGRVFNFNSPACGRIKLASKLPAALADSLHSFGLPECSSLGLVSPTALAQRYGKCVSESLHLDWTQIFGSKRRKLPVKLEICSGTGEWVVAQALAESSTANWVALEIMHDRVHGIFSRSALAGAENLCTVGGDAGQVLPRHVPPASLAHICVNYPEPPHVSGDEAAENSLHLLTGPFFAQMHAALSPDKGGLTILSDNLRYCRTLASTVAWLRSAAGVPLFASAGRMGSEGGALQSEEVEGVSIFHGLPGEDRCHTVKIASHFDSLWAQSNRTGRYFIALSKI